MKRPDKDEELAAFGSDEADLCSATGLPQIMARTNRITIAFNMRRSDILSNCMKVALVLMLSLAGTGLLLAQADRATIEGIVTDASGAAIADAKVSVIRIETNAFHRRKPMRWAAISPPTCRWAPIASGWKKTVFERPCGQPDSAVANERARGCEVDVGSMTEHVEVTADAPMLDASTATDHRATDHQTDSGTAADHRRQEARYYLLSGFLPGRDHLLHWGARVNGSNPGNSEVFLDGAPASQGNVRGGIQENGPAVEQVGEFSVVTNSFNAEYGRTGSWFTNITIRSGTNQIHGSAFDFFDNDALNARSFFQQIRSTVRHNEGGFTLGAPVYLPKIYNGRNKTFFFFGQQLVYYTNTNSGSLFTVPRADFRSGDFSQLLDSTNVQIPIFDPEYHSTGRQRRLHPRAVPGNVFPPTASALCLRRSSR